MTYLIDNTGLTGGGGGTPVTGGIFDTSSRGVPSVIYGDTGPEKVTTDLMKFKLGYDITPALQAIFTAAYENRVRSQNNPRNYLTNTSTGQPFFGGGCYQMRPHRVVQILTSKEVVSELVKMSVKLFSLV